MMVGRRISLEDEIEMIRLYLEEKETLRDIAGRYGIGYNLVRAILVSRQVRLRDRCERSHVYEPSPEEIERETEAIRKGWSEITERRRRASRASAHAVIPILHMPLLDPGRELRVI
jgi:transposase-like protein